MKTIVVFFLFLCSICPSIAFSELLFRGYGYSDYGREKLVYDTELNITWLDYSSEGKSWSTQKVWADNLSVTFNGTKYDNWRLPSIGNDNSIASWGFNNTSSEIGHLFYSELGNKGYRDYTGNLAVNDNIVPNYGLKNTGPFENLDPTGGYWFKEATSIPPGTAWSFEMQLGVQDIDWQSHPSNIFHGLAVYEGDIGPSIPYVPKTYGLFVGVHDGIYDGDIMPSLFQQYSASFGITNPLDVKIVEGDVQNNGVTIEDIKSALASFHLRPEDKLVMYFTSHGGTDSVSKDSFLAMDENNLITDDLLADLLREYSNTEKWVFLDACHSGGFWNSEVSDKGDFNSLNNIAFFAAAQEDGVTYFGDMPSKQEKGPIFGRSILNGLMVGSDGHPLADGFGENGIRDGSLTANELFAWLNYWYAYLDQWPEYKDQLGDMIFYELAFGDPTKYSEGLFNPFLMTSPDFKGIISTKNSDPVPEPTTMLLFGTGLAGLVAARRRKKKAC